MNETWRKEWRGFRRMWLSLLFIIPLLALSCTLGLDFGAGDTAPPTPAGLTAGSQTSTSLTVSWSASTEATSYQLFRDTSAGGSFAIQVYSGSGLSFTDSPLASSTTYYYKVRATNATGSSSLSGAASGTTLAETPTVPPTPTDLAVGSPTSTSLQVSWMASPGATSYQVFRDTSAGGGFATQAYSGSGLSFTDSPLASSSTYYYKVRATSSGGSSDLSAAASGETLAETPTVPATPAGLTAGSPTSASLMVSWNASIGATSYQVFRDTSAGGGFATQVYSGGALSFSDSPLASSTTYYYKVQATNTTGSSVLSAAASGTTLAVIPTVPPTPAGLTVSSQTSTSLQVSWSASTGAASYQLFRDTSSGGSFSTQVYSGSGLSFTDSPLASSTTYYYKVQATNTAGSSGLSAAASGTTLAAAPPTPTGLAVGSQTSTSLQVSWSFSTGAASYQLFRDTSSGGSFSTQVYSGSGLSFTDSPLASSTTYYYKVRATNTTGSSGLSAAASGTTLAAAPPTPTGLAVGSPTSTSLTASWNSSTGATSYQLFRDTSAGGSFATQVYSGSALSYTDSSLASSTTYYYKVRATNPTGSSGLSAAGSGTTLAQTPTVPTTPAGLAVGSPTSTSLQVSWNASPGATSYQLFRDLSAGGSFATQVYSVSSLSVIDMWLASNTTYYYKVRATNSAGSSPLSAAISGYTSAATALGCTANCHNTSVSPDPLATGRHFRHVSSLGYACDKCHHDYQTLLAHRDGTLQTAGIVFFDASNPAALWTDSTRTCSSTSCHGSAKTW